MRAVEEARAEEVRAEEVRADGIQADGIHADARSGGLAIGYVAGGGQVTYCAVARSGRGSSVVSRPHQVGVLPRPAHCFQDRAAVTEVERALSAAGASPPCLVVTGMGGVGKTQLAARCAGALRASGSLDLLVWISAGTRAAIVAGYAQTAAEVLGSDARDPEQAARAFLAWLEPGRPAERHTWLVVLDDLADPADLRGLWPPRSPRGHTLITTRRRDAALAHQDHQAVHVDLFTADESAAYLATALAAHGRTESPRQLAALADELGHLPLALSQAVAYLVDAGMGCAEYRVELDDRARTLAALLPEPCGLPDDQTDAVSAAWSLSVERADRMRPAGLARPMLQLLSVLDAQGVPASVVRSPPALAHLAGRRTAACSGAYEVTERDAVLALRALHRLSLVDHTPDSSVQTVRVHHLVQRATRDDLPRDELARLARTAADALIHVWPETETDVLLAQALRANAQALTGCCEDSLLGSDGPHTVLFRTGQSLGATGQTGAAVAYFRRLTVMARARYGAGHPDTLSARHNLALWRGMSGDPGAAATAFAGLVSDRTRCQGPDHPDTLAARHALAHWRGEEGDPHAAVADFARLVADTLRAVGPDHPETLAARQAFGRWQGETGDAPAAVDALTATVSDRSRIQGSDAPDTLNARHEKARWLGEAGDAGGAVAELAALVDDRGRIQGPYHPDTLNTRHNLAHWRGQAHGARSAVAELTALLDDRMRIQGPYHPDTFSTRHNLAHWRGRAGDAAAATADFAELVADRVRFQGSDHPGTRAARHALAYWQARRRR
ncbi:NB-ARC domain-containing protein [Streptomyces sp. NPDC057654]|uniref:NB-ARC domain-containing protein n=1 Tax=Streptomyces sp. NPDC057654 TaxID=3346196 RepID=UPI0036AB2C09